MDERRREFEERERNIAAEMKENQMYQLMLRLIGDVNVSPAVAAEQVLSTQFDELDAPGYSRQSAMEWPATQIASRTSRRNNLKLASFILELYKLTEDDREGWQNWRYGNADTAQSWGCEKDPLEEEAQQWENYFAFYGQLAGLVYLDNPAVHDNPTAENRPLIDTSSLGLFTFEEAFGFPQQYTDHFENDRLRSEHAVRCACLFMIGAADQIWANCKTDLTYSRETRRQLPRWHFGLWRHWKQGMENAQSSELSESTQQLLREALTEMNRVDAEDVVPENSGKWW